MNLNLNSMFDIIILSSEKDFNKLPYVYDSITNNIIDSYGDVYLISNKRHHLSDNVINYVDDVVLNIDRGNIRYRPNWVAQQYLKLFQDVTQHDYYLVVDADIIFNKKFAVFTGGLPTFFIGRNQNHSPYFEYMRRMLNLSRGYSRSFINEFMLFDKRVIAEILSTFNNDKFEFIRKSNKIIDRECHISEYELYGNYVYEHHRNDYHYKNVKTFLNGRHKPWSDKAIEREIERLSHTDYDLFTIHSWL